MMTFAAAVLLVVLVLGVVGLVVGMCKGDWLCCLTWMLHGGKMLELIGVLLEAVVKGITEACQ